MNKKIKLIWDFKGVDALKIAEHHCAHLKEFVTLKKWDYHKIEASQLGDFHSIAYITVNENDMILYRDALKPHRGEVDRY